MDQDLGGLFGIRGVPWAQRPEASRGIWLDRSQRGGEHTRAHFNPMPCLKIGAEEMKLFFTEKLINKPLSTRTSNFGEPTIA